MANIKITDLTAYADPTSTDVLPIVDVGADVTKKVSVADLLENAGSGTEALPGIAFDGDPNTGIYRPGADQVAISTNGTGRLFVDSSGRVGVGTTSPDINAKLAVSNGGAETFEFQTGVTSGKNTLISFNRSTSTWVEQNYGASAHTFNIGGSTDEVARIDSSGRLLVGTSTARSNFFNSTNSAAFQLEGQFNNDATASIVQCYNANTQGATLVLGKSNTLTVGANALLADGHTFGRVSYQGNDGSEFVEAASILAQVDGTPGANDMPGRLVFSVTAGGASSPIEAMRIKNTRVINFSNAPVYADNAAAKTGGLVDGDVYRTSTGDLKIVYT